MGHGLRRTAFDQASYAYWTGKYGAVNVKDFGAVGDGVHDDTAAIQAAIDMVASQDGGTVFFPPGVYLVNAPNGFVTGNDYNCILALPFRSTSTTNVPITVELVGATYPAQEPSEFASQNPLPVGAVIETALSENRSNLSYASIIGGPSVGIGPAQTAVVAVIRRLTIRQPYPADLTALDLSGCVGAVVEDVICDVNAPLDTISTPDSGTGVWLPDGTGHFIYGMSVAERFYIAGLGQAIIFSAHAHIDAGVIQTCGYGLVADTGFHPAYIGHVNSGECTYDLTVRPTSGQVPNIYCGLLDIEVANGNTTSPRIYDPNNLLVGSLNFVRIEADVGVVTGNLPVTGASNLLIQSLSDHITNLPGGSYIELFMGGTWINLNANAPSAIGVGGPGNYAMWAYVSGSTDWFPNANPGDFASRVGPGSAIRLGTKTGNNSVFDIHDTWVATNAPTTALAGPTAGTIYWAQPEQGTRKVFIAVADAYANDTTTATQTITFPTAYTYTPAISTNTTGMVVSATTTTLTIIAPSSTTTSTYSGVIEVVGI